MCLWARSARPMRSRSSPAARRFARRRWRNRSFVTQPPPGSPADGERYLIAAGATGGWAGHDGELAFYLDGVWRFATAKTGWLLWSIAEAKLLVFDGALWRDVQDIAELENMTRLGINTA